MMVVMEQKMSHKAHNEPECCFRNALKTRGHGKRIRQPGGIRQVVLEIDSVAVAIGIDAQLVEAGLQGSSLEAQPRSRAIRAA